jgi:murein DD-endopeptidase MepM/ murein hydrolase activator NlpD
MTDESRDGTDAVFDPNDPVGDGSRETEPVYDLGADIGSWSWFGNLGRLILLLTIVVGLGAGAPWLAQGGHGAQAARFSDLPFPLTLDFEQARLAKAGPVPVLHTELKLQGDWRAPAGWRPHPADSASATDSASAIDTATAPDADRAQMVAALEGLRVKTVAVRRGDTLINVLTREGAATEDAHAAIEALRPIYDPKHLRVGQDLKLSFSRYETVADGDSRKLITVAIPTDVDRDVRVSRAGDGDFHAEEIVRPLEPGFLRARGTINDSLFLAATKAGVPVEITLQMIRLFSYDVDFQRDLQPGDKFEVFYRVYYDDDGRAVKSGAILFARLMTKGRTFGLYRYTTADGDTEYFDEKGRSNKKALMRTPIDGARISSGFGMRRHPILGYSRMHKGLDFAAPMGTPIMAAGDGVVEFAGAARGYGRLIKLKHFGPYETYYGHMSRIAKGIHRGVHVKQGQIIAYVGQAGMATGPHLHYEVRIDGKPINPASNKVPINKTLQGKALAAFERARDKIDRQFAEAPSATAVARAD